MDDLQATAARNTQLFIIWLVFLGGSAGILYGLGRVFRPQLKLALHGALEVMAFVGKHFITSQQAQNTHLTPPQIETKVEVKADTTDLSSPEDKAEKLRKRRQIIEALSVRQRPTGAWLYGIHEIREIVGGDVNKVAPMVTQFREAFEAELVAASV